VNLSETQEVLEAIGSLSSRGRTMALATITSVRGSTYRRPGARLLVPDDGPVIGNLSGGCLEGQVEAIARDVMSDGRPRLEFYDLTADDEVVWGWGLGCNGAIEVLIEPAEAAAEIAQALATAIRDERTVAVGTVLDSTVEGIARGERVLRVDGDREGALGDTGAMSQVDAAVANALLSGNGGIESIEADGGTIRVFIEVLEPPLRLLVCGAGHDAIPLVRHAALLGWKVTVVDDREAFLSEERFPEATQFVLAEPSAVAEKAGVDRRTYAVVMSHNYLRDRDYLHAFLGTDVAYIGMLGPRARLERLLNDLAGDGVEPSEADREKLFGPAGLDLGGEGPDEIAAAIVGEVLAIARRRAGGSLRERRDTIHDHARVETG
jgi:xanthine/CO dehydrogenase XdhC/CoxF family maturation factor